jgi:site-specific DNA-methyltransferase (adenine-specific)
MFYKKGTPIRPERPKRNLDFSVANTASMVSDTKRIERGHPCPRPIDQVMAIVDNFTKEGGLVLDPFAGSGTTGVACELLGRNYILIEKETEYIEIIKKRLTNI